MCKVRRLIDRIGGAACILPPDPFSPHMTSREVASVPMTFMGLGQARSGVLGTSSVGASKLSFRANFCKREHHFFINQSN